MGLTAIPSHFVMYIVEACLEVYGQSPEESHIVYENVRQHDSPGVICRQTARIPPYYIYATAFCHLSVNSFTTLTHGLVHISSAEPMWEVDMMRKRSA